MALSPPRIVCAANRYTHYGAPVIIPGARHFDAVMREIAMRLGVVAQRGEEGFMDQHGVFYNRLDAWEIAERNNQIVKRVGGDGPLTFGLFSENLY